MKKLFAMLAVTAIITSCNDTDDKAAADSDSARAKTTSDSLADIKVLADTLKKPVDNTSVKMKDTSMNAMPNTKDTIKK